MPKDSIRDPVRALITDAEFQAVLREIALAETHSELAKILHSFSQLGRMNEAQDRKFFCDIDDRRLFLDEKNRITVLSAYERMHYIQCYKNYPNKQPLVAYAIELQQAVTKNMSLEEINTPPEGIFVSYGGSRRMHQLVAEAKALNLKHRSGLL